MLWEHPHYPLEMKLKLERDGGLPWGVKSLFAYGHRAWFHQDLWNTPLILAGPGIPVGARRTGLSANLDIVPTLLDAFDLPRIPGAGRLEGQSLLGGVEPVREQVFGYGHDTAAVREAGGLKLIQHNRARFLLEGDGPLPLELFDLGGDPLEDEDLAKARASDAERLNEAVRAWRAAHPMPSGDTELGELDRAALEDLGYADGGLEEAQVPAGVSAEEGTD
jgi:arylsulfatase A-like enzyme